MKSRDIKPDNIYLVVGPACYAGVLLFKDSQNGGRVSVAWGEEGVWFTTGAFCNEGSVKYYLASGEDHDHWLDESLHCYFMLVKEGISYTQLSLLSDSDLDDLVAGGSRV